MIFKIHPARQDTKSKSQQIPLGSCGYPWGQPLGKPLINAQGYIGQLIHILEVEWVIADCIMDLIKHFYFICL